jgi:GNAT superfamily N-acetyltransferase
LHKAITEHSGEDYLDLLPKLQVIVERNLPGASCSFYCLLYYPLTTTLDKVDHQVIEELQVEDIIKDPHPNTPKTEHVLGIRDGSVVLSCTNIMLLFQSNGSRFYSVGVRTHPDHRRKGLGRAVVSAMLEHILSQGDIAVWQCAAANLPSIMMARSLGFKDFSWTLNWTSSENQ